MIKSLLLGAVTARHPLLSSSDESLNFDGGVSIRMTRTETTKHKRLTSLQAGNATMPQTNHDNLEYVGPLYIGGTGQELSLVWDTGSDWLVVASY